MRTSVLYIHVYNDSDLQLIQNRQTHAHKRSLTHLKELYSCQWLNMVLLQFRTAPQPEVHSFLVTARVVTECIEAPHHLLYLR